MEVTINTLLIIIGMIPIIIGVVTLIYPNFERLINFPGNATIKAFISITVGIIIIVIGLFIPLV